MFKLEKKILLILSAITVFLIILGIVIGILVSKWRLPEEGESFSDEETREKVLQSLSAPLSAEGGDIAEGKLAEILRSLSVPKK
jgi:hypothetical protein